MCVSQNNISKELEPAIDGIGVGPAIVCFYCEYNTRAGLKTILIILGGQEQFYPGASTSFTVTFQKAGTYHYICQLHPWMTGSILVK